MSLLRATFADARSPIIGGLGQIVPTVGPPAAPAAPVLDLPDFPEVLIGWESDAGLGAYALDAGVTSWVDRVGGEELVQATSIERPYYIPGEYSSNGKPILWMKDRSLRAVLSAAIPQPAIFIQVAAYPTARSILAGGFRGDTNLPIHFELEMPGRTASIFDYWVDSGAGGPYAFLGQGYITDGFGSLNGEDTGLDTIPNSTGFLEYLLDDSGAGLIPSFNRTVGTAYGAPPTGFDGDVEAIKLGRTLVGGSYAHSSDDYAQAFYVLSGSITPARLTKFYEEYLDPKWKTFVKGTAFPTFGASDYAEFDAADLVGADLSSITSNWVDRQNGYEFVPNNNPVLRTALGRRGGQCIRFANTVANQYMDCAALTAAHPLTFIVGYMPSGLSNVGSLIDSPNGASRMVMWEGAGPPALYAGSSVQNTNFGPYAGGFRQWAGVFNDNSSELHFDGMIGSTAMAIGTQDNTNGTRIGNNPFDSGRLDGWIEFVYYWDKVLTREQILQVMAYRGEW